MRKKLAAWVKGNRPRGKVSTAQGSQVFGIEVDDKLFEKRMSVHNAISEQIWREQQLVSNRMTWMLQFQGFITAIYTFAGSHSEIAGLSFLQLLLATAGLVVTVFVYFGIVAAQTQSSRLKLHWMNVFHRDPPRDVGACDIVNGAYPQPFSRTQGSRTGRLASRGVCFVFAAMWISLQWVTLTAHPDMLDFLMPAYRFDAVVHATASK